MLDVHPDQIWNQMEGFLGSKDPIPEIFLKQAINRGKELEKLLRLVNRYHAATRDGHSFLAPRNAIFQVARELK